MKNVNDYAIMLNILQFKGAPSLRRREKFPPKMRKRKRMIICNGLGFYFLYYALNRGFTNSRVIS